MRLSCTRADCKEAVHLIECISAETLLADRGYDTNDILAYAVSAGMEPVIPPKKNRKEQRGYDKYPYAVSAGMEPVIPPKKNRKEQRGYDKYLYKLRHLVENSFCL